MAAEPTQVIIPFLPLLLQITTCLNFKPPEYTLIDETQNNVSVSVKECLTSRTHTYVGGQSVTVGDSCESAARQAVNDLMNTFSVIVKDFTYARQEEFEKCTALYKLKYTGLDLLEKGQGKASLYVKQKEPTTNVSKTVTLDYMTVLRTIIHKLGVKGAHVDTVEHDPTHFTAFFLLDTPGTNKPGKCIVGECCSGLMEAKSNIAEKVITYLIAAYNLEIVDANHKSRSSRIALVACALQRESFLTIQERVLGIKEEIEPSCFLAEGDCTTPRTQAFRIPTLNGPPQAPRKRRSSFNGHPGSVVPESRNHVPVYFNMPAPLETVYV